ncbi:MAG: phage portal protein [Planctomycetota bacterium]
MLAELVNSLRRRQPADTAAGAALRATIKGNRRGAPPAGPRGGPDAGSVAHARNAIEAALSAHHEAYKLARRDRPREDHQPIGYSGDAAILGSHDLMHRRVRDLVRNTPQGKRIVSALVALVVGRGVQTFAWPFSPGELFDAVAELGELDEGVLGPRLAFALESDDLFDRWANDPEQFDAEGRLSWPEMQRLMMSEVPTVGSAIAVRCYRRDYKTVPLCYQLIEAEQLDHSVDREAAPGQNRIVGGRELDGDNRVVAYHVYLDHPHEFFHTGSHGLRGAGAPIAVGERRQRIAAGRVIDLTLFGRPSESQGATWLAPCGEPVFDRSSYTDSEIRTAAADSVIAYVAKLQDADRYQALGFDDTLGAAVDDDRELPEYRLGHSPIASVIRPDESLEMVRQTRPNPNAHQFLGVLDRDTAAATPLSYYTLTGDYASTNFSSVRAAKLDEDADVAPIQQWFATHAAIPVRTAFTDAAAAAGLFRGVTPGEYLARRDSLCRFDAVGTGRDLLDPYKEGEARTARLRTKISTFKEECARLGKHWLRVLMQSAAEQKVASMLGVELDFTKAGAGAPGSTPAAPGAAGVSEAAAQDIAERVALLLEESRA